MTRPTSSIAEITATAIALLCRQIGPANTARFLNQFQEGIGDYAQDRSEILGDPTVEELVAEIKRRCEHTAQRQIG